jgi:hypothetical protein
MMMMMAIGGVGSGNTIPPHIRMQQAEEARDRASAPWNAAGVGLGVTAGAGAAYYYGKNPGKVPFFGDSFVKSATATVNPDGTVPNNGPAARNPTTATPTVETGGTTVTTQQPTTTGGGGSMTAQQMIAANQADYANTANTRLQSEFVQQRLEAKTNQLAIEGHYNGNGGKPSALVLTAKQAEVLGPLLDEKGALKSMIPADTAKVYHALGLKPGETFSKAHLYDVKIDPKTMLETSTIKPNLASLGTDEKSIIEALKKQNIVKAAHGKMTMNTGAILPTPEQLKLLNKNQLLDASSGKPVSTHRVFTPETAAKEVDDLGKKGVALRPAVTTTAQDELTKEFEKRAAKQSNGAFNKGIMATQKQAAEELLEKTLGLRVDGKLLEGTALEAKMVQLANSSHVKITFDTNGKAVSYRLNSNAVADTAQNLLNGKNTGQNQRASHNWQWKHMPETTPDEIAAKSVAKKEYQASMIEYRRQLLEKAKTTDAGKAVLQQNQAAQAQKAWNNRWVAAADYEKVAGSAPHVPSAATGNTVAEVTDAASKTLSTAAQKGGSELVEETSKAAGKFNWKAAGTAGATTAVVVGGLLMAGGAFAGSSAYNDKYNNPDQL